MDVCRNPELNAELVAALAPEEFGEEARRLEEHAKGCPVCAEELRMLQDVDALIRENRETLADALTDCPEPDEITAFALDDRVDPFTAEHLKTCADCAVEFALVKELRSEVSLSPEAEERRDDAADPTADLWERLREFFNVPSLALGAVVACLLVFVLYPARVDKLTMRPALSDVTWTAPESGLKLMSPPVASIQKKEVALVLLVPEGAERTAFSVDTIYREIKLPARLSSVYRFTSPGRLKEKLAGADDIRNPADLVAPIFTRTDASYLMAFELIESDDGKGIRGTIFGKDGRNLGAIYHPGVDANRVPERITSMGAALLIQAEE